jgi:hypothetical protein
LKRVYRVSGDVDTDPEFRIHVGCADPQYLKFGTEKVDSVLKIGPVVDSKTKKKVFGRNLTDVYTELTDSFRCSAAERQTAGVRAGDVRKLVAAELQFQLLSASPGQAISLSTAEKLSEASFVLYNFARICQIIRTFEKVRHRKPRWSDLVLV